MSELQWLQKNCGLRHSIKTFGPLGLLKKMDCTIDDMNFPGYGGNITPSRRSSNQKIKTDTLLAIEQDLSRQKKREQNDNQESQQVVTIGRKRSFGSELDFEFGI